MNCDTGNLSYVDKVKLIAEQIDNGKLDFTSSVWTDPTGNLSTDDNTLQKVLDKFNDFKIDMNIAGDFHIKDIASETSPNFTIDSGTGLFAARGEDNKDYSVLLPGASTNNEDILIVVGLAASTYHILNEAEEVAIINGRGQASFISNGSTWVLLNSSNETLVNVTADAVKQIIKPDIDTVTQYRADALQYRNDTLTFKTAAELAAEAAETNGKIYADITAGINATVDGEFFYVVSSNNNTLLELYQNSNGIAIIKKKEISREGVLKEITDFTKNFDNTYNYTGNGSVYPIVTDQDYKVVLGFDSDSSSIVGKGLLSTSFYGQNNIAKWTGNGPIYPIVTDREYRVLLGIDTETKSIVGFNIGEANSSQKEAVPLQPSLVPVTAEVNHLLSYGQSLSVGAHGTPVLSVSQPYSNITFSGGPRASSGDYSSFKPLVEDDLAAPDGGTNRGETICSGAANYAITKAIVENGVSPEDHVILASAPGHGGYRIDQLEKGTNWYADILLAHIQHAYTLNNNYACHAFSWMQGENDINVTDYTTYYNKLIKLQEDIENDVKAISGQGSPVFCLTYQVTFGITSDDSKALAQLDAVKNSDKFYLTTPLYHIPYYGDNVHLTNIGYKWVGGYVGRAYKQLVIDKEKPDYINPVSAFTEGTKVTVAFDVPKTPLVLDVDSLANTQDYGFKVIDDAGVLTITDVKATDTSVEIQVNRELVTNAEVRYAMDYLGNGLHVSNGASGNLRDSTPDTIKIDGNDYPLYHVAPHFKLKIIKLGV